MNAAITAAYWMIGQHIVEFEQSGEERAAYGTALIKRLAVDLTKRFGRGFSRQNLQQMRVFYLLAYPVESICQTPSGKSESVAGSDSATTSLTSIASRFPLPWSAYVRLLSVRNTHAREF